MRYHLYHIRGNVELQYAISFEYDWSLKIKNGAGNTIREARGNVAAEESEVSKSVIIENE